MNSYNQNSRTLLQLQQISAEMRLNIIKMLESAGSGHSAGPLGLADIFTTLYFHTLRHDPRHPNWDERDILLLSNGHCAPVQYASMAMSGYFPVAELTTLRKFGSRLQGHPERTKLPGLENTSGPLGSGLSQACGIALGLRLKQQHNRRVICVTGDGELNEGNIWEAAMFAPKYNLHRLTVIVDRNNIQIDGTTEQVMPLENLRAKWESFGWHVLEVDGNNIEQIVDSLNLAYTIVEKPTVIIAHTIPGKGVEFMEFDYHWHGVAPNHDQARLAVKQLRTLGGRIGAEYE